ncbi:hypothetical protein [Paenibacillus rigui]|uniref:Amidase n=1 Tax=Paenibacillus rigui TaxID=554312 RepID=A0A229UHH2_9BACL|nr:hypothetical protein [Paenibacillus rigui]OXM82844.1 hypothetical protein CF651_28815 [Paenibacillus rigui]
MTKHRWFTKQASPFGSRCVKVVLGCFIAGQALTGFSLFGGAGNYASAAGEPPVKSTWLWNPYIIDKEADSTLQQLADKQVNRVYIFIDLSYPANYYSQFIRKAHAMGIQVEALGGAPNWVLPEYNKKLYVFIDWVKRYNNAVQPEERFSGIHLDVEPYVLPEWGQDSDTTIGLWMDTVSGFQEEVKSDSSLQVGMDMPVWLEYFQVGDGQGGRTTLSDWFIRRMDEVTLMAYRDQTDDITDSVKTELDEADRAGASAIVAVDTVDSGEEGSFYGEGEAWMEQVLGELPAVLGSHPSFKGTGVHEWESWLKLKP